MPRPNFGATDYQVAALALLPTGAVWPRTIGSVLVRVMGALAPTLARLDARAGGLLDDSPAGGKLIELLPEWESTVGLPDPCSGPDATIAARQAHVQARFAYSGGQSAPYFVAYAAALGYTITITEFAPARADFTCADDPVLGEEWAHFWQVQAPAFATEYLCADIGYADEPLEVFAQQSLVCELTRIKPAHTILEFVLGGQSNLSTTAPLGSFVLGENTLA